MHTIAVISQKGNWENHPGLNRGCRRCQRHAAAIIDQSQTSAKEVVEVEMESRRDLRPHPMMKF